MNLYTFHVCRESRAVVRVIAVGCIALLSVSGLARQDVTTGAERVAPGTISTGRELSQAISPDGQLLLFARRRGAHFDIMVAERAGNEWSAPKPAPFNSEFTDADPFFSAAGDRLFFLSTRPGPGETSERKLPDIWMVERDGDGWRAPRNDIGVNRPETGEGFMSLTHGGTIVFASDRDRPSAAHDIYIAEWNGAAFEAPEPLDVDIRTQGYTNPLIAPDGDFLIFESALYAGEGSDDLFIVFREADGWTTPVNLGPTVNTPQAEGAPWLSPDGAELYFGRMSDEGGERTSNLYRLPFTPILERARRLARAGSQ